MGAVQNNTQGISLSLEKGKSGDKASILAQSIELSKGWYMFVYRDGNSATSAHPM